MSAEKLILIVRKDWSADSIFFKIFSKTDEYWQLPII